MRVSFDALPFVHRWLLIAILDAQEGYSSYFIGSRIFEACGKFGVTAGNRQLSDTLDDLIGHFIRLAFRWSINAQTKEKVYDWIHPTVRDLVVEHLSCDDEARNIFLANCSTTGIALAMSIGGGHMGRREMPLLTDERDWTSLCDNVKKNIVSYSEAEFTRILEIAKSLAKSTTDNSGQKYIKLLLECCRICWSEKDSPREMELGDLERYYALSVVVEPLPPGPGLEAIWQRYSSRADAEIATLEAGVDDVPIATAIRKFMKLIHVLEENEPRFLKSKGYPANYKTKFGALLPRIDEWIEKADGLLEQWEADGEAELLDEARIFCDNMEAVIAPVAAVAESGQAWDVDERIDKLVFLESDCREKRDTLRKQEEEDDEPTDYSASRRDGGAAERLDIGELFSDL
jgi:hypothetical protein